MASERRYCTDSELNRFRKDRTVHLDLLGTHIARIVALDVATSALPHAPVLRQDNRGPVKRLLRRP